MLIQNLGWDANLSAFTFWVVAGLFISTTDIKSRGTLKGLSISIPMVIPIAFLVGWSDPISLIPITILNIAFGSLLGYLIEKYGE